MNDQILDALTKHDGTRAAPMSPGGAWVCYCGAEVGDREEWVKHQAEVIAPILRTHYAPNYYADIVPSEVPDPLDLGADAPTRIEKGIWRHKDDHSPCTSYPDSFDWNYVDSEWRCNTHDRVLVCLRRDDG